MSDNSKLPIWKESKMRHHYLTCIVLNLLLMLLSAHASYAQPKAGPPLYKPPPKTDLSGTPGGAPLAWEIGTRSRRIRLALVNGEAARNAVPPRYQEAESAYRFVIGQDPKEVRAYVGMGHVHAAQRHYAEAEGAYQWAIKLAPKSPEAHVGLGNIYAAQRRFTEAAGAYKTAIKLKPKAAEAHYNLGMVYHATGDDDGAWEEVKALTAIDKVLAGKLRAILTDAP